MMLDAESLYRRANEILEAMAEDHRPDQDRIAESVWLAHQELAENGNCVGAGERSARIVTVADFAAVNEPGAEPLVGTDGEALIPAGGDVMFYGDGGASKTTLSIDLAFHLAAGDDWLGIAIPNPARVGIIEAEGPRPLFRRKLRQKLDGWSGSEIGDRLQVLEEPWAKFRFPDAEEVAARVAEHEIDLLIVGPLTRVGWEELGTLQQVRDFMDQAVAPFRAATGRRLTIVLIHHENKGGAVSGAWEGAGDTLFHAQVHGRGRTTLTIQKARWSGEWHKRTLDLDWTDGEGFAVVEDQERDLIAEIVALLRDKPDRGPEKRLRTTKEIAATKEGGIGANEADVKAVLVASPDRFISRTKEAAKKVGRNPTATVWELAERCADASMHLNAPASAKGGAGEGAEVHSPYRDAPAPDAPPNAGEQLSQRLNSPPCTTEDRNSPLVPDSEGRSR